jgi:hypothetical protein
MSQEPLEKVIVVLGDDLLNRHCLHRALIWLANRYRGQCSV